MCAQGKSRSTVIVMAYIMAIKGLSAEKALEEIQKVRKMAEPNSGFMQQMREFMKTNEFTKLQKNLTHTD